jgi:hypothetical protein
MPIHDWTRFPAGTYHFFHQRWISAIADALNGGGLPQGYYAMSEVDAKGPIPDVLALKSRPPMPPDGPAGIAVLDSPPAPTGSEESAEQAAGPEFFEPGPPVFGGRAEHIERKCIARKAQPGGKRPSRRVDSSP